MEKDEKCTAILLAAGNGKRMNSGVAKQYMLLNAKPLIWYSLDVFQRADPISDVIVVVGKGETARCREAYIEPYGFTKVSAVIEGGAERYFSVWQALRTLSQDSPAKRYLLIHDCARPLVEKETICAAYEAAREYGACTAGVVSKDTVKIADRNGLVRQTPARDRVWQIQTPQVFEEEVICGAYKKFMRQLPALLRRGIQMTDDATIVERMLRRPVKLVEASYRNIKITTPEDLRIAESLLGTSIAG
ncbi:MAG: 2-C-methyl-D-erythritol 4-phosphate cytidylyltransferase [Clostridium sp.]|jgi:2-C-methyl-D-erythritol 4-phosphate cytidylyltransferase|nr:2-C-methyl-D-erythritol 4-phosphate cytidylyltransferase [Clostridium sp.]